MKVVDLKELALKKVKITGNVIGKFGTFEIEQIYINETNEVLEVGYTFPIVETATVVGFEVNIGDKVLRGVCKEKGEAKKEYQKNILKGNSAYMMEQETDSIFKISVGKIEKKEEVKIKINYIDKFEIIDNTIKILMPTLVTPRYKSNITSKLIYGKVNYTVDFNIKIDKTINRKSISCPSHKINVIDEENAEIVEVVDYDLSKDFKLDIELKKELSSSAIKSKTKDGKEMVYLSFMPEILDTYEDSEKEYLFIVDVSGSMAGEKLDETKRAVIECLKQLDVGDKFNIIPFESRFEAMNIRSIEYNEENMQKATEYINNLRPLGGTEILNPIKFALYEDEAEKIILLFTDGQVGNESEIISFVNDNIRRNRIFPFGIDTNVNSAFIKQLARVGNGKAELIYPHERIDDKIIRTFARIQTPLLENIEIDYGSNKLIDEIREEKSLFNYEFFNVFAKIEKLEDDIQLKGKILDKEYIWKINKEYVKNTEVDLEILFAKQEIERLEEYINNTNDYEKEDNYKKMIIEIATKYNINSKYTSFITVFERKDKLLEVPKYQETVLSHKFTKGAILGKLFDMMGADVAEDYEEGGEYDMDIPVFEARCSNLDVPRFLRKDNACGGVSRMSIFNDMRDAMPKEISQEDRKSNMEILKEEVEKFYNKFILQNEKSIYTYLLLALYFIRNENSIFDFDGLLEFLKNNKEKLTSEEIYMKLIYLCYNELENSNIEKNEIYELLDEDYRKAIYSNLSINVILKELSESEIQNIINENTLIDNIDDIIWYLYKKSNFIPPFLRR